MATYSSPGAAASQALQAFVDKRKAEARQAMLDELNRKNVESQISERDSMNDVRKQSVINSFLERQAPNQDVSLDIFKKAQDYGPEVAGLYDAPGSVDTTPIPRTSTSETLKLGVGDRTSPAGTEVEATGQPINPEQDLGGMDELMGVGQRLRAMPRFRGTGGFQQGEEQKSALMRAVNSGPTFNSMDPLAKAATLRAMDPEWDPNYQLFQSPNVDVYGVDRNTMVPYKTGTVPRDAEVNMEPADPSAGSPYHTASVGYRTDGTPVNILTEGRSGKTSVITLPEGVDPTRPLGRQPTLPVPPAVIPSQLTIALQRAREAATPRRTVTGGQSTPDPKLVAALRQAELNALEASSASKGVKATVRSVLGNPKARGMTIDQIMATAKTQFPDENYRRDVEALLSQLMSKY